MLGWRYAICGSDDFDPFFFFFFFRYGRFSCLSEGRGATRNAGDREERTGRWRHLRQERVICPGQFVTYLPVNRRQPPPSHSTQTHPSRARIVWAATLPRLPLRTGKAKRWDPRSTERFGHTRGKKKKKKNLQPRRKSGSKAPTCSLS